MKIKVLYREITNCTMCPYGVDNPCPDKDELVCMNMTRKSSWTSGITIPPDCPLPDMRLDTEDDSTE